MPRSLFKQLYCEMFAFSAFGQGPHTEYYFILQGDVGIGGLQGGFGSSYYFWLQQDSFFFLDGSSTVTLHIHIYTHKQFEPHTSCDSYWSCEQLSENLFTERVRKPEAFAQAKCAISEWFMGVRSHYLCPYESICLTALLGGFFWRLCLHSFVVYWNLMG